jgi:Collagen triple helix repeat (20 copies)
MLKTKRLTYANVAATLALVFSMSGGALAANHYLITSTKQISPKVIKALKGKTGKAGPAGPQGIPGKEGATGKEGTTGKEGVPGSARSFGAVLANGTLNSNVSSKNVASTSNPTTGVFCIKPSPSSGITTSNSIVIATVDAESSNGSEVTVRSEPKNCAAGEFEVDTFDAKVSGSSIFDEYSNQGFSFLIP